MYVNPSHNWHRILVLFGTGSVNTVVSFGRSDALVKVTRLGLIVTEVGIQSKYLLTSLQIFIAVCGV